ncbi:hypothetical protein Tco_1427530 [Tanacetum coccineum]
MILESVEHGLLIWPTIEENGVTRTKKYAEFFSCQGFMRESSITNASLPPEWSKFVTDVKLVKDLHTTKFDQLHAYLEQYKLHANEVRLAVLVFSLRDDLIACLNKTMVFLTTVASSRKAVLIANISNYGSDVISEDFGKRFVPQQELSAEQAFWFRMSNPTIESFDASHVKVEAPKELPKVSLVNESHKNLKFHLAKFDNVVNIRTTPDARTEGVTVCVLDTCPNAPGRLILVAKKVAVTTPIKQVKKVRIASANVVPPKKTTSHSVETQKPELKVYSRKPKNVKNVGSSKKAKIVESKNANHLEPNNAWGSNATDIPSSSSLVMTCCPDCSLVSGIRMFKTYDKEPLSAHELCYQSHFCNLNKLAKDGLTRGIPRLKIPERFIMFSHVALGKSKKSLIHPKAEDIITRRNIPFCICEFCGLKRVVIFNGKRYIIVIVGHYPMIYIGFGFEVKRNKASEANIKTSNDIQVRLNAPKRH